eukprot:74439-Amphidinium_carterae.1
MLLQIRSFWHEGLLTCADDIPGLLDFYDGHEDGNYSRCWRLLLRWLNFQDIGAVVDRFDRAMMLRGEGLDEEPVGEQHVSDEADVQDEREEVRSRTSHKKKDQKKSKSYRKPPSEDSPPQRHFSFGLPLLVLFRREPLPSAPGAGRSSAAHTTYSPNIN